LRFRLSLLMFLQYAFPGALLQLYSLHLQNRGFDPWWAGCCAATQALATVLVALLVGQAADRWFSAERCLGVCACLAGIALWVLVGLTDPVAVFVTTLAFWLLTNPILLLGTSICFTHLAHPEREFGRVRSWGTVGWMVPPWVLLLARQLDGVRFSEGADACTDLFRLGGVFAFVLGAYAFLLPHTPPRPDAPGRSAPLAALKLLRGRPFAVYSICTLGLCVCWPFTTQATPLLLKSPAVGIPEVWIGPTLTVSQVTEALSLSLLPMLLLRLGLRGTMLAAWAPGPWPCVPWRGAGRPAWSSPR
jgi:hypothetical protein